MSLDRHSESELVSLYRSSLSRGSELATLKAWFKLKISTPQGQDAFKAAFYYKVPGQLRLDRWGFMNQLTGTVWSRQDKVVVQIPSKNLYLLGNNDELAAVLWGRDFLLSDLPSLLLGRPPLAPEGVRLSRQGRYLLAESATRKILLGFAKATRELVYQAELDATGNRLWEVFYHEPKKIGDLELMSYLRLQVGAHTKLELSLQKVLLNRELAVDLFEARISPNARIESLHEALSW